MRGSNEERGATKMNIKLTSDNAWPSSSLYAMQSVNTSLNCLKFFYSDEEYTEWLEHMRLKYPMFDKLTSYPLNENDVVMAIWAKKDNGPQLHELYKYQLDIPDMY